MAAAVTVLRDTTGADVLRQLAAERRNGGVATGLALTLVVVTDESQVPTVEEAVTVSAAAHPCRLLVVTRATGRRPPAPDRLDAEIVVGGRWGGYEAVIMRTQGRLALHAESVVIPLLAPDVPVVTWWNCPPPQQISNDPLGVLAERRITDVAQDPDPVAALHHRAVDYVAGDTDLAWTRLTGWRSLLAGALDWPAAAQVTAATVRAEAADPGAALLAGWLRARLGVTAPVRATGTTGIQSVHLRLAGGAAVAASRRDGTATLERTGHRRRTLPLFTPTSGDLIAEELRRLGADHTYAEALSAATGVAGVAERGGARTHTWMDPEEVAV
jgi:glucose-6-phosphate dehydrogenase assembly protein OpcA